MHFPEKYAKLIRYMAFTILFFFIARFAFELYERKESLVKANEALEFIALMDDLATNIALERGLTEGVLGASALDVQSLQLQEQRTKTNQTIQALKQFTPEYIDPAFIKKMLNTFWQRLEQRQEMLDAVDALNRNATPFVYYSRLNQLLLEGMHVSLIQVTHTEMQRQLLSCLLLSEVKEEDGKARGALNGIFASLYVSPGLFFQIEDYIMKGRSALRQAELLLPETSFHQLDKIENTPTWVQVSEIHQDFLNNKGDLAAMTPVTPVQWFELATQRIDMIQDIQKQAFMGLQETLQKERFMLLFELFILILVSIATAVMFTTSKKEDNH